MEENNHKVSFKIHGAIIGVYIDKNSINVRSLYPLDKYGIRLSDDEMVELEPEMEILRAEMEVKDIESIALVMNKETFDRFCEAWRNFHSEDE